MFVAAACARRDAKAAPDCGEGRRFGLLVGLLPVGYVVAGNYDERRARALACTAEAGLGVGLVWMTLGAMSAAGRCKSVRDEPCYR